jgi:hypothetical protein
VASRAQARSDFPPETRIRLLEGDVDRIEAETDDRLNRIETKLDGMNRWIASTFVALATAILLFAINLAADAF